MIESTSEYTFIDLRDESAHRKEQPSFHFLSEGDVRGEILNLRAGSKLGPVSVPLLSLLTGISGEIKIATCGREFVLRSMSQLCLLPNVSFILQASDEASCQLLKMPHLGPKASSRLGS
jgi:hypothetical protein